MCFLKNCLNGKFNIFIRIVNMHAPANFNTLIKTKDQYKALNNSGNRHTFFLLFFSQNHSFNYL